MSKPDDVAGLQREVRRLRSLLLRVYPLVEDRAGTERLQAQLEREVMGPAYVRHIRRVLRASGLGGDALS